MIAPAMIKPINCGTLILLRSKGVKRIMKRMIEKISTGLVSGREKFRSAKSIIHDFLFGAQIYGFLVYGFLMKHNDYSPFAAKESSRCTKYERKIKNPDLPGFLPIFFA